MTIVLLILALFLAFSCGLCMAAFCFLAAAVNRENAKPAGATAEDVRR